MLSIPPATIKPLCPSWMLCDAIMMDFIPEAHTLLIVVASVESGILIVHSAQTRCLSLFDSPSTDSNLSRWTLTDSSLNDVAHVNLLDSLWLDTSSLHCMFDRDYAKLRSRERSKGAIDRSDGCP